MSTRTTVAKFTLSAALGLTACAGTTQPTASQSAAPSTSPVEPAPVTPSLKPLPTMQIKGGAIRDLVVGECGTSAGRQKVSGTLTSSQAGTQDFLITITWTNANGDVRGRGFEVVRDLARGKTKQLSISAEVADGAARCVMGVDFGTVQN